MSKPTNLNRARKQAARAAKRARGDANAAKHGRTKAEKDLEAARGRKAKRDLDGHRRGLGGRELDGRDGEGED